jgi:hypothetical protein
VSACDVFGLRLYTPFEEVKSRVEGSGFINSREARFGNREFHAWASDFTLTIKFVQRDPADETSMVMWFAEMYIHAGRRQPGRLDDDFETELVQKYGPPPKSKFDRQWGEENGKGPNVWFSGSTLRIEDRRFHSERETAIRLFRERLKPVVRRAI